ncbi:hypothetical protein [Limnohabitans sp. Rim8]|uniref:hypothetical protein n=1 Tax=Limnohabitans sp. Rim8 TaxID=1100718 RepID=UPI00260C1ABE|nr:hypothetical protein [Limnohabitans sp. Rim8]
MIFRHLYVMLLMSASAWALLGCGIGGDSGSTNTNTSTGNGATGDVVVTPTTPTPPPTSTPTLVQPGVYAATVNGQDFWGVITPTAWGPRWYGLHYAALNPDIYSGDLAGAGTASASVSALRYFQNTAAIVLNGTASMKSAAAGQVSGDLNLVTAAPPYKQAISFVASTPTSVNYNQAAKLSDIAGGWTGRISYGLGSNDAFSMNIASSGSVTADRFGVDCQWLAANATFEPNTELSIFRLNLTMNITTSCDFKGQTLTGVAFLQKSPVAGKTQRLIWVATIAEGPAAGKGISFKADR